MKATLPSAGDDMGLSEDDSDEDDEEDDEEDGGNDDVESPVSADIEDIELRDSEDSNDADKHRVDPLLNEAALLSERRKGKGTQRVETASDSGSDFPTFDDEDEDLLPIDEVDDKFDDVLDAQSDEEAARLKVGKRKRKDERKERRKKRKELPTFGSYEDYQAMIEAGGGEEE